jgi:hypothetical protein
VKLFQTLFAISRCNYKLSCEKSMRNRYASNPDLTWCRNRVVSAHGFSSSRKGKLHDLVTPGHRHGFHTLRMLRFFLVTHRNKVLTHHELLQTVWGYRDQHPASGLSRPIFMKSLAFLYEFFMRIRLC